MAQLRLLARQPTPFRRSARGRATTGRARRKPVDCSRPFVFNVPARSVAGIPLDVPDSVLDATLPTRSVQKTVQHSEQDTYSSCDILLCEHLFHLGWNGLSTDDPEIVTTDSLRVGMPISRFDSAWGKGKLLWSEGGWVMYYFQGVSINLGVDGCVSSSRPGTSPVVDRRCSVGSIWVSTPQRATPRR